MNLSLLTNKQMEMRTNKFMIYVFSAIMLGGMVACSSDDPETDTGNGNGNGGNAEAPYVWGTEGAIKTCDHLLFDDDKTENAKGTVIGNGDQEFIFNRFEQGQNRKFTNISSSGIGLTLVKYLVELHNGEIRLESEVGKGSKFIISLPVK